MSEYLSKLVYLTKAQYEQMKTNNTLESDALYMTNEDISIEDISDFPTLGAAASKSVVTTIDASADLPTSNAVKNFVEGKGYITNTDISGKVSKTGDTMSGNLELNAASGDSPSLLFTRNGSLTDWKIVDTAGKLSFQSGTNASTWTERGYFKDNSGDFVASSFTGSGAALTSLNGSNISSGTVAAARLPEASTSAKGIVQLSSAIDSDSETVAATTKAVKIAYDLANDRASSSDITNAINALNGGTIGTGSTTKTITSLSQSNGNISATFSNIAFPVTSVAAKTGAVTLSLSDIDGTSDLQAIEGLTNNSGLLKKTAENTWSLDTTTYKTSQTAVSDPTTPASGTNTATAFIDTISQNTNGEITATKKKLPSGTVTGSASSSNTLTTFSQTDGKVTATFGSISIAPSQINTTIPVSKGGTGLTTSTYVNAVLIGNASTAANAFRTIRTNNGAFYATAQDGVPQFGTLPIAQGGTGATSADDACAAIGAVKTSGDTINGNLDIYGFLKPNWGIRFTTYEDSPTEEILSGEIKLSYYGNDSTQGVDICSYSTDGTATNHLFLGIDNSTNETVIDITAPNVWRTALGITDASTTAKGLVQLSSATNSTSTDFAATPSAVKSAYDLASTANTTATNVSTALGALKFSYFTVAASGSKAFTVPNSSMHLVVVNAFGATHQGMYLVDCNGSGTLYITTIHAGSALSTANATNKWTLTNGSGMQCYPSIFTMHGNPMT